MAKQYDFIQQECVNGQQVMLNLKGEYKDAQDFDAPTVIYKGMDITDVMELVGLKSIGFTEWLEERVSDHIEYLMGNTTLEYTDATQDDVFKTMGDIFKPHAA